MPCSWCAYDGFMYIYEAKGRESSSASLNMVGFWGGVRGKSSKCK